MGSRDQKEVKVGIGGIVISLMNGTRTDFQMRNSYRPFITNGTSHLRLKLHLGSPAKDITTDRRLTFNAFGTWSMYKSQNQHIIKTTSAEAVLDSQFESGDVYLEPGVPPEEFFLNYPLDELLMISLLPRYQGLMAHACGLNHRGRGILFAGTSGAGKTTTANLWKGEDAVILSDDRVIIRRGGSQFWIYGTPWHGHAGVWAAEKAPLDKIFFLKHAKKNSMKRMSPRQVLSQLLIRSFTPMWDKCAMKHTLSLMCELAEKIPSYELGFIPDKRIINFVSTIS